MKKLIKLSAVALLSFFIVACNKPDPAADFKKLADWQNTQIQTQEAIQTEFYSKMDSGDPAQFEVAIKEFTANIEKLEKDLVAIDIQSDEVKVLKDKMLSLFVLSKELLVDSIKIQQNPALAANEEEMKKIQQKINNAIKSTQDLETLFAELQAKYGSK